MKWNTSTKMAVRHGTVTMHNFPKKMRGEAESYFSNGQKLLKRLDSTWELGNNGKRTIFLQKG